MWTGESQPRHSVREWTPLPRRADAHPRGCSRGARSRRLGARPAPMTRTFCLHALGRLRFRCTSRRSFLDCSRCCLSLFGSPPFSKILAASHRRRHTLPVDAHVARGQWGAPPRSRRSTPGRTRPKAQAVGDDAPFLREASPRNAPCEAAHYSISSQRPSANWPRSSMQLPSTVATGRPRPEPARNLKSFDRPRYRPRRQAFCPNPAGPLDRTAVLTLDDLRRARIRRSARSGPKSGLGRA